MSIALKLRDPTAETSPTRRPRLAPPQNLDGKTVALMDIGKARGKEFLDRLEGHFKAAGVATIRYRKPTNTKVAPVELMQKIAAEAQLAVIALSDWGSCTSCSLHDLYNLDSRGLPGVNIVTLGFVDGVEAQSNSLGFEPGVVFVPHPVQNRTRAELETYADDAFTKVMALLKDA